MKLRKTALFALCLLLTCLLFFGSPVFAAWSLYDDFEAGEYLDWMRWEANQVARDASSGFLFSFLDGATDSGGRLRNETLFAGPGSITSIQADVNVDNAFLSDADIDGAAAEIMGIFYHNTALNQDIIACLDIGDQGNGLEAWWRIVGLGADGSLTPLGSGTLIASDDASPLTYGVPYQAILSYDSGTNSFSFTVDERSYNYSSPHTNDGVPSYGEKKSLGTVLYDYEKMGGGGAVFSKFDNVVVNSIAYDDFSTNLLDGTKWNPLEFVRQVVDVLGNKKAQLNIRSIGSGRQADLPLAYSTTPFLEAKVAVKSGSTVTSGAVGRAMLGGYYYNQSRGPGSGLDYNDREGDVWVQVALEVYDDAGVDKIKAVAKADASNFDGSSFAPLYSQDLVTDLSFDTEHTLSIEFSGASLTFKCDAASYTYNIATPVYEPSTPVRILSSRILAGAAQEGYLFATFDDVYVDLQFISGIVLDNFGAPMEGVEVMVRNDAAEIGNSVLTGVDGHFSLEGMPSGPMQFIVKPDVSTGLAWFRDRFYLPPGQSKDLGTIKLPKGALVAGSISLSGGTGGEMQDVEFWYGGKFEMGWGLFDTGEQFAFRLPAGQYQMNLEEHSGFTMVPYHLNITDVNDDLTYGALTLTAYNAASGEVITGTVTDSALHSGRLELLAFLDDVEITPENLGGIGPLSIAEIDPATGNYTLFVPPTAARGGRGILLVLSVFTEGPDSNELMTVVASQTVSSTPASGVNFTYDTEGYDIQGIVRDGGNDKPLFGASVLLYQVVGADEQFAGFAETDHHGSFVFHNVRPGTYRFAVTSLRYSPFTEWTNSFALADSDVTVPDIAIGGPGDELAVDFGDLGLFHYDGAGKWNKLSIANPYGLQLFGRSLAVDFEASGLYLYNGTGWSILSSANPEKMLGAYPDLFVDFGTLGLYFYNNGTGWVKLSSANPDKMVLYNGKLAVGFGASGLYLWDGRWSRISSANPEDMISVGVDLFADFGSTGLYRYSDGIGWSRISVSNAEGMAFYDNALIAYFPGYGLYRWNGSWTRISTAACEAMMAAGPDLFVDFGLAGLYRFNSGSGWMKISVSDADGMGYYDKKLVAVFPGYGLYEWAGTWNRISSAFAEDGTDIDLYN